MTTAVLISSASDLAWEDTTVAARLADQLRDLGVQDVHVVPAAGLPETFAAVAGIARSAPGGVVVLAADVVTQREALAGLLADPRIGTGVLSARRPAGPRSHGLRSERGRAVAAASPYHTVSAPTEWSLGALKVAAIDTDQLAEAADQLARLAGPGWGDDATALLLVALVRAGVHVGQSDLRELFWARPATPADVERAQRDIAGHDEEKVLLDSSVKAIDGFFTTFFVSPYSKYLARWAARHGLTPNQVTIASLLLGVLAAAAFATGERWGLIAGAILLQVAFTTDCVDGQLARFTRTFTPLGAWLDSTFDRLKEYLVYGGLALGAAHAGDPVWALAGAALALQTVRHAFDFSFAAAEHREMDVTTQVPLDQPSAGGGSGRASEGRSEPEAEAGPPEVRTDPPPAPSTAQRTLSTWRRIDRTPGALWLKRMIVFPIGERFAAISITAALWTPRTTFVVLLTWGTVGAIYGLAGRILRALLHPRQATTPSAGGTLVALRDDGPLASLLAGNAGNGRFAWAGPPLRRATEYGGLVAMSPRGAYPLLLAVAFRHYDLVYRPRYQGRTPPAWLATLAGGWDGRLVAGAVLLLAGAFPEGFWVAGGILGALFVAECVASWRRFSAGPAPYDDTEGADE